MHGKRQKNKSISILLQNTTQAKHYKGGEQKLERLSSKIYNKLIIIDYM